MKHIHTEGPGSILKSRFARGVVPLVAALLAFALAAPEARAVVPEDFAKTFTVTVQTGLVDENETLTSFPLLLRLGTAISGFDYDDFKQNGKDILVQDASGNALPYELENWDTTGESRLWVRVPSVAAGTTLSVYYGTKETVSPPAGMWSGYAGVWHFNEAGDGATTIADSSANALNGTSHASSKARSGGKLGGARGLELDAKNGAMTTVPDSAVLDAVVPTFTVSGWVRPKTLSLNWGYLFARKTSDADPCWGLQFRAKDNANSIGIYSNGSADNDSNRALFSTSGRFTANTWTKYHVVYDNTTIRLYLDGALVDSKSAKPGAAVSKSNGFGIGGFPTSTNHSSLKADQDEVRLMNGAASAAWVAAEYRQESGSVVLSYGEVRNTDASAPTIEAPVLSRNPATGAFTVSAELSENVPASVVCDADGVTNAMTTADVALPMTYSAAISGLSANTTYACLVSATSTGGTVTESVCPTAFYNGDISIEKISDAAENGLVPGVFRISRADTAHDLVVSYTVGGTATPGQTFETLSGTATIPAGSNSVDVVVVPLLDAETTEDTTVVLTLNAGLYGIDAQAGSAELTVVNLVAPAGYNTWIATSGGLASVSNNWSAGHPPTASENVLFDGRFSSANCEWDAAASATVASWTQTNDYTGVITLKTVYPGKGDFQCLTVTGPMAIHSGTITHPQSRTMGENHPATWDWVGDLIANETYRLRLAVGSLTVGAAGLLDAKGKGYLTTHDSARVDASHGGRLTANSPRCYGDPKEPIHIGLPDRAGGNYYNGVGGGAIYVTSEGAIVVNGIVRADSDARQYSNNNHCCGAAGSVYLQAASVSGTGTISAYGPGSADGNNKGTGGRVAIVTEQPVDRSTFASINAGSDRRNAQNSRATRSGGSGTVFFKDASQTYGTLLVDNVDGSFAPAVNRSVTEPSTDGDWTFDSLGLGNRAILTIPVGTTLHLPGGLDSVFSLNSSGSTAYGSIRYEGGTLDLGSAANQTMAGNWMLTGWTNLTLNANVVVKDGAAIGVPAMASVKDSDANADPAARKLPTFVSSHITIDGNLTVETNGLLRAVSCGFVKKDHNNPSQYLGVLGYGTHGGRHQAKGNGNYLSPTNFYYKGYDSVFSPSLPGCSGWYGNGSSESGGAFSLVVTGHLALDGSANAYGNPATGRADQNNAGGAGGSIDIMAGTISGSGTINANGGSISSTQGGGGRIAIKLTASGADFSHFAVSNVFASGRTYGNTANEKTTSSAGTVYLQTAAEGDKCGTVYIAMSAGNRLANNTNTTEMASLGYGGDAVADYKRVKYVVSDYGHAAANVDMAVESVTIADDNSGLDLEGHALKVKEFLYPKTGGDGLAKLSAGTYTAAQLVERGITCVVDTSADKTGTLKIGGGGFHLIVR